MHHGLAGGASALGGHRATVVQTPTASPIVVAVPRGVVTTHCRSWGLAHSRCEARWLLYEPRQLLDRAWRGSLPRATPAKRKAAAEKRSPNASEWIGKARPLSLVLAHR